MAKITVHNPHPRLVNVALGDGKFTRILPNSEAEVERDLVKRLLAVGELTTGSAPDEEAEDAEETEGEETKTTRRTRRR